MDPICLNGSTQWRLPQTRALTLPPCGVELWRVFWPDHLDFAQERVSCLSSDEYARYARFMVESSRSAFLVAHVALRDILSRYVRCDPAALVFSTAAGGKPALKLPDVCPLTFSLSHSKAYVVIAITAERDVPLGVDVEFSAADRDLMGLAERFFAVGEVQQLRECAPAARSDVFYRIWTRKEAYVKALGVGLSFGLDAFEVSSQIAGMDNLLSVHGDVTLAKPWALGSFFVAEAYCASFAVSGGRPLVAAWDWMPGEKITTSSG